MATEFPEFMVKDANGNTYGPASMEVMRQWIGEGRVTAYMQVSRRGTEIFLPARDVVELRGLFGGGVGEAAAQAVGPVYQTPVQFTGQGANQNTAIASLVCSLLGFALCPVICIVGIVLGHQARSQIRRDPQQYGGAGLALAGLIVGYAWLGVMVLLVAFYALVVVVIAMNP